MEAPEGYTPDISPSMPSAGLFLTCCNIWIYFFGRKFNLISFEEGRGRLQAWPSLARTYISTLCLNPPPLPKKELAASISLPRLSHSKWRWKFHPCCLLNPPRANAIISWQVSILWLQLFRHSAKKSIAQEERLAISPYAWQGSTRRRQS